METPQNNEQQAPEPSLQEKALRYLPDGLREQASKALDVNVQKSDVLADKTPDGSTKGDRADQVIDLATKTNDRSFLEHYLEALNNTEAAKIDKATQLKFADHARYHLKSTSSSNLVQDLRIITLINQNLPEAKAENELKAHNLTPSADGGHIGPEAPDPELAARIAAGIPETQREIKQNSPLAYAKTYPGSKDVAGPVLDQVLNNDLNGPNWLRLEDVGNSLCGLKNPYAAQSEKNSPDLMLLNNPNLSNKQLQQVAQKLAEATSSSLARLSEGSALAPDSREIFNRVTYRLLNNHNFNRQEGSNALSKIPKTVFSKNNKAALFPNQA